MMYLSVLETVHVEALYKSTTFTFTLPLRRHQSRGCRCGLYEGFVPALWEGDCVRGWRAISSVLHREISSRYARGHFHSTRLGPSVRVISCFLLCVCYVSDLSLHCTLSCGVVYCNRSCLCVCLFMGLLPRLLEIACIDPHQTGFVGKCSDHLQLMKFWPSRTAGKGLCGGAKIFGSSLLQPARSVCVSLSAFFIFA